MISALKIFLNRMKRKVLNTVANSAQTTATNFRENKTTFRKLLQRLERRTGYEDNLQKNGASFTFSFSLRKPVTSVLDPS